ncbi:SusC/RagA family TonB-linked outer membrane protein [Arenibacter sp. GZD96]|uniref:SusC/RagA family TonB-linked outer membrane protein n=1 Tax=Aurantibrevibacter litoralis TaxID=3106030 RepID=UPI002AFF11EE|nr:SusC/RagA family TonB-linked outer membrane protein [Arenibacter sp. GZD-96]MEA1784819.1 SusC/RagA family TonB-linked outer membrane protein [Arenibacter sp. GZD-96]
MIKKLRLIMILALGLYAGNVLAQTKTVTGTVTSAADGLVLPGVNVLVQGTTNGTQTDFDGNYSIEVAQGSVLVFSYLGTQTATVTVGASDVINIALQEDASQLDEVVVTALGIERQKKSLSYATQGVDSEELAKARNVNAVNGLSGKVAGISVTTGSTGVGSESKVLLRGNRSIGGSSQPLYVVDGILLNGDISNISPDDIQDISVLKGANAAALYGSRAQNGAIIVTTKSGRGAKEGISTTIGFTSTLADAIFLLDYQNQFGQGSAGVYSPTATTSWGPVMDGTQVAHWTNDPNNPNFGNTYAFSPQSDNVEDFFRTGHELATNVGVNINNEKSNAFIGYTFTEAGGIIPGNDLKRHSINTRLTSSITDKLQLDAKVNYIRDDFSNVLATGEGFDNPLRYLYILPRNIRTQDIRQFDFINDEGKVRQHYFLPRFNGGGNPYWTINNVRNPRLDERVIGLLSLKYQITPDLSILGRSTIDRANRSEQQLWHNDTFTVAQFGQFINRASNSYDWNTDFLLNYNKQITDDFKIDVSVGANQRAFEFNQIQGQGTNFTIENFFALSNTALPRSTEAFSKFEVQSIYGLGEISYKNAIFLNITARNDWSSTLPADNRSYFYPSFGLTAVVSDLMEMPDFFSFLKLRGSWAEVGNDTSPFSISRRADILAGTLNINPNQPASDLRPETTQSTELGFDARFLNNRFRLDFTYYKTNTFDQIFQTPTPSGSGITSRFQNGGDIQNKGVEIMLGANIFSTPDFSWDIDFNFATNQSEVLEILDGEQDELIVATDFIRQFRLVKGEEFGDVYSRGFQRDAQGNVIVGADGVPLKTNGLDVKIANFNPDWLGGIRNSFRFKNFNFSALIDIRQGGTIASFSEAILASDGLLDFTAQGRDGSLVFGQNIFRNETAVTESGAPNTIAVDAEALWSGQGLGGRNAPVGEAFVRDASNVRLRELILGYTVPQSILSKTFISSANISLVGRNLFFFSNKAENVDPEAVTDLGNSAEGREAFAPPTTRTFGVSINFGF